MATLSSDPGQLRSTAETLVAEAAEFVRRRRAEVFGPAGVDSAHDLIQTKSSPTDPVTVVDTETEHFIRERLTQLRPGDAVLGEEGGGSGDVSGRDPDAVTWVVDPIDGTVNFMYDVPAYAVSVAAQIGGASVAGAVADVVGDRIYSAGSGLGARVKDRAGTAALRCTDVAEVSVALLGTGFGYSPRRRAAQAELLARLLPTVRDVRRIGSAALDLCMVAAGRLDAYYEHGIKTWDHAAGSLIAAEAGARVLLPGPVDGSVIVAAAPGIAEELLTLLQREGALAPIPA
ncbi:inositol monophosphatase family protein [Mycolicibacter kumamotonensis]|uniref:Inositol-1-monophosphatase n=1 Tax=Mycolicibacter kumamotonensis TaxID=354243 RepID=A0A1B8SH95_9MYCO|nr:inositol monophosphatase family protein [Mycolicibacter kumamotonensis]NDJ89899.1 inositol monophosphatase [Mycolicibacter kumamotonensis]OBY32122.1 inositol monophosphatase [Mycolicibacter kumamotonensis]ORA80131.1 inositol monophosphatase [Mycolicibacter kumamotonensis]